MDNELNLALTEWFDAEYEARKAIDSHRTTQHSAHHHELVDRAIYTREALVALILIGAQ